MSSSPHVVIVGAEKGGVGKSTVSRTLADYYQSHGIVTRKFDGEHLARNEAGERCGVFARFCQDAKVINIEESDDQMKVFDGLREAQVTLLDLPAGALSKSLAMLKETCLLDGAREGKFRLSVLHVIGSNKASFDEIAHTASAVEGAQHFVVLNHINKSKFTGLPASVRDPIIIPQLIEGAADVIDRKGVGFEKYIGDPNESPVLTGYTRTWLARVFAEYDRRKLNAL